MSQTSILVDVFIFCLMKEKKKKKRRNGQGAFSQGKHALLAMLPWDFLSLSQSKAVLRVSP
jgi:hypothetical protein